MDKVQLYADYINLMSYDYKGGTDTVSGHHTNLFTSSDDAGEESADKSIRAFLAAGVPPQKLVMGIAFYGKAWEMESNDNNGLNSRTQNGTRGGGFTYLKDSVINKNGFVRYWDEKASAPYLFHPDKNIFISYDDEESVKLKCDYVKKYNLGGVMFWEYSADHDKTLLNAVVEDLR